MSYKPRDTLLEDCDDLESEFDAQLREILELDTELDISDLSDDDEVDETETY